MSVLSGSSKYIVNMTVFSNILLMQHLKWLCFLQYIFILVVCQSACKFSLGMWQDGYRIGLRKMWSTKPTFIRNMEQL